ncbi:MAG: mechanosensitive ion channel family protein [Alphaproteobacteria bacterium]|nr:mechanosensitive ion channel family protein [Alphaproteobacteria bacterium]
MSRIKSIVTYRRWSAAICLAVMASATLLPFGATAAQQAAARSPSASEEEAAPVKVHELLILLADPKVQQWLVKQGAAKADSSTAPKDQEFSVAHYFGSRLAEIREHILTLGAAFSDLPGQFKRGTDRVGVDLGEGGRAKALLLLMIFVALGFGVEWVFRRATRRIRGRLEQHPLDTVNSRLRVVGVRFLFGIGLVATFALGSVGAFLALDWPPMFRQIVLAYLVVILAIRIAMVLGRFLLAPNAERFRIVPVDTRAARFWSRRLTAFVGWFILGWVFVGLTGTLGYSLEVRQLIAYTLGLGLLGIAVEAVWRRPAVPAAGGEAASVPAQHLGRGASNAILTVGITLLWALWVLRAMPAFWLLGVIIALPLAIRMTRRAVENVLRPCGLVEIADGPPSVIAVSLGRGLRALLIIGAVGVLAWGWGVDLMTLAGQDTFFSRFMHGALSAVIILLVADVVWHATRAAIDVKLAESADLGYPNTDEARHRARLRTLLPIFRNLLFVAVIAVAVMMALAAMGVQIGPLIAGAGVVGVAVGFGAQTFVRDVIAGMFYLIDDAFRVGEYIQSGNYKGTVEGFSIRSVKLRHHRGPVYTVPFSLLGAVQNQSRDWVIDKLMVGITYDSDIERARKLIKGIGQELAKDPEFAPLIIEPLKMQGVEHFGDFAVQIRMKMMTLPGEQFVIRRKALAMIKKAFDENGIKFAFPTVQVAGEGDSAAGAVAQRTLELAPSGLQGTR